MICSNNRKYIKNLDIVRKCGCTKKCYWLKDATTQFNNSSLDKNLEHTNITILSSSNNSSNYNRSRNSYSKSNYTLGDSFKVTEKLFNDYIKRRNGETSEQREDESNTATNSTQSHGERDETSDDADYMSEYETDGVTDDDDREQMQLNPSTDFYDDDEDDDGIYDDDDDDEEDDVNVDDNDEPELLPEAKGLIQSSATKDEEEDMGYDEDDERIAIAVERPKEVRSRVSADHEQGFINEEGSGNFGRSSKNAYKENQNDRFRFDYMNKYRRKQQKLAGDHSNGDRSEVDLRESSGNFANDDEDNDDDSDDDDDEDSDGFFNSKRKSNSRYFRKNTNDAIKIISTPLGKVGIVYQQTPTNGEEKAAENAEKKSTSFTDFDALSPDPESSHRLASSHPKITPVLTPDGKVALLYRGDSENSKYEPIRNLTTHKFSKSSEPSSEKKSSVNSDTSSGEYDDSEQTSETDDDEELRFSSGHDQSNKNALTPKTITNEEQAAILPAPEQAPTTGSFIIRPTDSVLPMINRPLSEVLGIKKNQFKQFRVKDISSTTTESALRPISGLNVENSDSTTLHFLTKVNLADYPTSSRSRNFDFDFSRDNTMLDERTRNREQQDKSQLNNNMQDGNSLVGNNQASQIANEEILSKTEVVNLAIIPHFDEELERLQRLREYEERRHHRQRHRQKQNDEDLSGIHCIMQAMMGIAAISTVFGMLGTFFKQRILDQLRLMHW